MQRRIVRDKQVSEEYVKKWEAWKRELYEIEKIPLKTFGPFLWMEFNYLKVAEPVLGDSLDISNDTRVFKAFAANSASDTRK